ncbi:MAG: hypothetical protein LBQ56_04610, partial [Synergistaceae bacterium]|nr:hypothetical protein [Synergistaceae bacterium]
MRGIYRTVGAAHTRQEALPPGRVWGGAPRSCPDFGGFHQRIQQYQGFTRQAGHYFRSFEKIADGDC